MSDSPLPDGVGTDPLWSILQRKLKYAKDTQGTVILNHAQAEAMMLALRPVVQTPPLTQEAREQAIDALMPFSSVGNWLFARDADDNEPLVTFGTINNAPPQYLTRGQFKAASNARMALIKSRSSAVDAPQPRQELWDALCLLSLRVGLHVDLQVIDVVTGYEARLCDDSGSPLAEGSGKTIQGALVALARVLPSVPSSPAVNSAVKPETT